MCMSVTCVRVFTEDRGRPSRAGVTGNCGPPDMGPGN